MLDQEEKQRYQRHISLSEVGEAGQIKLKEAKVLVVGAGGLGCPALRYLTAAGVGNIGIIDFDVIEESNLQRQILYAPDQVGKSKALTAAEVLTRQNPLINITPYNNKIEVSNALQILEKYDIIIDGTDNFSTRYLINDACYILKKPLIFGSMHKFEGQLSVFHLTEKSPTYRCLYPEPPEDGTLNCSEAGVLGVLPGIIGSMQALEAIKIITNTGTPMDGKLLCYNSLDQQWLNLELQRNEPYLKELNINKDTFLNTDYSQYETNCEINGLKNITPTELVKKQTDFRIIDIREMYETPSLNIEHTERLPMSTINIQKLIDNHQNTVIVCQKGVRSQYLINQCLEVNPNVTHLYNLEGGVARYYSDISAS